MAHFVQHFQNSSTRNDGGSAGGKKSGYPWDDLALLLPRESTLTGPYCGLGVTPTASMAAAANTSNNSSAKPWSRAAHSTILFVVHVPVGEPPNARTYPFIYVVD
ncbi:hypothetical protein HPB50_015340 [Hyalomma asiaticum]|uniref:Uncharacterized protein n=1 Tax=Hyalomma asiaticum TaxID=266040 RepID=A0ACB7T246_HYAAI|nr:hypothetical protein HPB50_015340 [Hyalomma asiaticum]